MFDCCWISRGITLFRLLFQGFSDRLNFELYRGIVSDRIERAKNLFFAPDGFNHALHEQLTFGRSSHRDLITKVSAGPVDKTENFDLELSCGYRRHSRGERKTG